MEEVKAEVPVVLEGESIEDLQKRLAEQIQALAKQRADEAERIEREARERQEIAELERRQHLDKLREAEEMHRQRKLQEEQEAAERKRQQIEAQKKLEQSLLEADQARIKHQEKLEWLEKEIANQEFVEEQHRKRIESAAKRAAVPSTAEPTGINVEHPQAPVNPAEPGGAVIGTEGSTPETPLMSQHLRRILRQAQRQD